MRQPYFPPVINCLRIGTVQVVCASVAALKFLKDDGVRGEWADSKFWGGTIFESSSDEEQSEEY